jgi:hypothetical protein
MKAYATMGEVTEILLEEYGSYEETVGLAH